jgi:hypothetical protein
MSIEAAACVMEAVGTAPPRNTAAADPSVSMSTEAACVALSAVKSLVRPRRAPRESDLHEELEPGAGRADDDALAAQVGDALTPPPAGAMNSATLGASVITERTGYSRSHPSCRARRSR